MEEFEDEDDFFDDPVEDGVHCVYCGRYMIDDCERGKGCHWDCEERANKTFEKVLRKYSR